MEQIAQGAEAVICLEGDTIIKERLKKPYRLDEIDRDLRKQRTRREARVIEKLASIGIPVPGLKDVSDKTMRIEMEFIEGPRLRDLLSRENAEGLCKTVGRHIGLMHANGIIHGDLTTSNMILGPDKRVCFIDFGLSFFSDKAEDKAVDLHLLCQALNSRHHAIARKCIKAAFEGYKETNKEHEPVMQRFKKVEMRGRNKGKG
ncbi:Kae1-associated kinase Bud32 [Candidatus Woesearchaeota archaeon CG10_big_fil_rev_8_21_14_0_10_47_5]|nr:MAG: Kae1-associated kinase Bud32 [Candidatus Woesearchaeota archaeon CG1_02_47_18]PIN71925.1 MAG: Kae1-associated kinase Bud32 [Candidatus Woesearchaeota archaeon CG10_big_fil_rev_8_21_14_0_10_47_5]HII29983.1 Kae1-associated serine/threonine protein kinase [Candidatus Woesearchaeota archaeon]